MSTISASTTSTTAYKVTADTTGNLVIQTGSGPTTAVTIDTAQNMGLGVTPSAWNTNYKVLEIGKGGSSIFTGISSGNILNASNAYLNSSDAWVYKNNGYAAYSAVRNTDTSLFTWNIAASGTAGNAITFTQAMTLDASGNLGVGVASPSVKLDVNGSIATEGGNTGITLGLNQGGGAVLLYNSNGNLDISPRSGYNTVFKLSSGGTEAARIDSSGNLLVGTTGTGPQNSYSASISAASGYVAVNHANGTGSGATYAQFNYNAGVIGNITQNGTTGVLYNLTSDYRLKNNPVPVTGAKEFIMALQPKTWDWWDGSGKGVGFIAHEFMEVAKHSGNGEKDAVEVVEIKDEDGNVTGTEERPVYQSIQPSSSEVMANLVAHIQELETRLAALENK